MITLREVICQYWVQDTAVVYGFKVVLINKGSPLKNEVKGKPA